MPPRSSCAARARALAALAALTVAASLGGCERSEDALLRRGIEEAGEQRRDLYADDAMRVLICGSSSPFPSRDRARPCTAVFAAGKLWVVDVGTGSWNNLALWRVPVDRLGAVLLTHFHSDHIGELGEWNLQSWVAGRDSVLRVIGPVGVARVVAGFNEAYALDRGYRTAHHGSAFLPPSTGRLAPQEIAFEPGARTAVVHDADGLIVTAFVVDHAPIAPAVGYRFDWQGRSVVVSGDTVKSASVVETAQDADLLVHEAQANHLVAMIGAAAEEDRPRVSRVMGDIPSYHTSPVEAAEVANEANVKLLLLTHLTPPPQNDLMENVFLRGVSDVRPGGWAIARDGLLVTLPADSDEIDQSELE